MRTWLALALAGVVIAGCATTGSVQGVVLVSGPARKSPADAVVTASPSSTPAPARATTQAAIVLTAGSFAPNVLLVEPGTTVHFQNHDGVYHQAFSVSPDNRFDLGGLAPGREGEVRFDHPGIVAVYCELHPRETGYVVVSPRHYTTRPDVDGAYLLAGLAPGPYTVRAWHPTLGSQTRRINLPPNGRVTVNFRY